MALIGAAVARALGVDQAGWERFVERAASGPPRPIDAKLRALRTAWTELAPKRAPEDDAPLEITVRSGTCPACQGTRFKPLSLQGSRLSYLLCEACGHAMLVAGAGAGPGYDHYLEEREYREAKGARLLERIEALAGRKIRRILEVGSGFGFTRIAAERRGMTTFGIDTDPASIELAEAVYGMKTFLGGLPDALEGYVAEGAWDLVLYQFVLEHLVDLGRQLDAARRAVAKDGVIAVLVPSADAAELEVFGASYRSLRADHVHLFTTRSIRSLFDRTGFEALRIETGADLQLLRGILSEEELSALDRAGRGPDILALARRR